MQTQFFVNRAVPNGTIRCLRNHTMQVNTKVVGHKMFYNSRDRCIVCMSPPKDGLSLVKHHMSYFPELIAFVHDECHKKIHDPDEPLEVFIQYEAGDSRRFYEARNQ